MLPKVDRTKLEITNPQFRVIETYDTYCKSFLYYPQRKWCGLFWIPIRASRGNYTFKYSWTFNEAKETVERYKEPKKLINKIHYL